jgi:N-methylhydantoinase A
VLCPRASGVLSALGLAASAPRRDAAKTVMLSGAALAGAALETEREQLLAEAGRALGAPPVRARIRHELRYRGQSFELPVDEHRVETSPASPMTAVELRSAFDEAHEARYGYRDEDAEIELVNLRASVWGATPALEPRASTAARAVRGRTTVVLDGRRVEASVIRGEPEPGAHAEGPALIALPEATLLVPPGWSARVDDHGTIVLDRSATPTTAGSAEG